jgi:hypothetical protein
MKNYVIAVMVFIMLCICMPSRAQELLKPSPGKSLVYFVRFSGTGALINFKYFHGDHYLGKFSGINYFTYETEPVEHVFWVGAENRDFLEASLEADQVYLVEVRPTMGAFKAAVKVFSVDPDDTKTVGKIKKILGKKTPIPMDNSAFSEEEESLDFYIQNGMKKYQTEKASGKSIAQLKPEQSFTKNLDQQ